MTEAQMNANRENAKKSTGPRSAAGKATSSRNATTHGLTAVNLFLPGEAPEDHQRLRVNLYTTFRPVGEGEEDLVDRIANAQWCLCRVPEQEAGVYRDNFHAVRRMDEFREKCYNDRKAQAEKDGTPMPAPFIPPDPADLAARAFNMDCAGPNSILKLSRYATALDRAVDRCLRLLKVYQTARLSHPEAQEAQEAQVPVESAAPSFEDTIAEASVTPPEPVDYKTNPIPRRNPAPEAPSEPLESYRGYLRATQGPVKPKSST